MTEWATSLTAALDALEHAARSHLDTTPALAAATRVLAELEAELPRMDEATRAGLAPQIPAFKARLTLVMDNLTAARNKLGDQLSSQRRVSAAMRSYGNSNK